jgi:hypothetical protein
LPGLAVRQIEEAVPGFNGAFAKWLFDANHQPPEELSVPEMELSPGPKPCGGHHGIVFA